jgi:hypothetical protein
VLSPAQADAVTLWIAHTHAFAAAEATPYLQVTSAEKQSGKSRLLDVLELVVARPWRTIQPSEAVLFRKIADEQPTMLLDEYDAIFSAKGTNYEPLRAILNAGHRARTTVSRCIDFGKAIQDYPVFCPKALAGIGVLPDTIADRSIRIRLKRRSSEEKIESFRHKKAAPQAKPLREALAAWLAPAVDELALAEPELPASLDDRAADGWEPLFAIADLAGADWPARAHAAAVELSTGEARVDESIGIRLLHDIREISTERPFERIPSAELVAALHTIEDAPWNDWHGKGLTASGLAKVLKRFEIRPKGLRFDGDTTLNGYERHMFEDAWSRYLPPLTTNPTVEFDPADGLEPKTDQNPEPPGPKSSLPF